MKRSIVFLTFLFFYAFSHNAGAITQSALNGLINGRPFYDPNQQVCTADPNQSIEPGSVYVLGDSLGVGVTPELKNKLPESDGWSVSGDSQVGRRLDQAIDVAKQKQTDISSADYVLVVLGTNPSEKNNTAGINELLEQVGDKTTYWLKVHKDVAGATEFNLALDSVNGVGKIENTTPLGSDGIHPSNYGALADTITSALAAVGGPNESVAFYYFVRQGLSKEQSAGIVGNMKAESGVIPDREEVSGGGGYGLVQWTGGRRTALENYAKEKGQDVKSLSFQLDYVWFELQGAEKAAYNHLIQQNSVRGATISFLDKYERAGVRAEDKRIRYAEEIFNLYSGGAPAPGSSASANCNAGDQNFGGSVVDIAKQELALGAKESDNSYHKYTTGRSEDWCGWFVSWVFKEAGKPFTDGTNGGYAYSSVDALQAYAIRIGVYHKTSEGYKPKPGDIAIFKEGAGSWASHVSIVVGYDSTTNTYTTIGGNETVGATHGVKLSTHSLTADYLSGFMSYNGADNE